jgi:hypothetical protein
MNVHRYLSVARRKLPADSELTCAAGARSASDGSTLTLDPGSLITVNQRFVTSCSNGPFSLGRRFEPRSGGVRQRRFRQEAPAHLVNGTPNDGMVAVRPGEALVVVTGDRAGVASWGGGARVKQGSARSKL